MEKEKEIHYATTIKTRTHTKTRQRLVLPGWVYGFLDISRRESNNLLVFANELDDYIVIRKSTPEERLVGLHLDLYLNGLWAKPTEDEVETFLELEELHQIDPPRLDEEGRILEYPFSHLTAKEYITYRDGLKLEVPFTSKDLQDLGMCLSSRTQFVAKCLKLKMIKELEPTKTAKRGRPLKRYVKVNDFPAAVPWEKKEHDFGSTD
jgi:hypothetical protein